MVVVVVVLIVVFAVAIVVSADVVLVAVSDVVLGGGSRGSRRRCLCGVLAVLSFSRLFCFFAVALVVIVVVVIAVQLPDASTERRIHGQIKRGCNFFLVEDRGCNKQQI